MILLDLFGYIDIIHHDVVVRSFVRSLICARLFVRSFVLFCFFSLCLCVVFGCLVVFFVCLFGRLFGRLVGCLVVCLWLFIFCCSSSFSSVISSSKAIYSVFLFFCFVYSVC